MVVGGKRVKQVDLLVVVVVLLYSNVVLLVAEEFGGEETNGTEGGRASERELSLLCSLPALKMSTTLLTSPFHLRPLSHLCCS